MLVFYVLIGNIFDESKKTTICTIPTISKHNITLKILKLYEYHAEQTNYKAEKKNQTSG